MIALDLEGPEQTLRVEAPSLIEAMPGRFSQTQLFDDFDPSRSALELFEDALGQALEGRSDSAAFDQALLETCAELRLVLANGIDRIEIKNGRSVTVDPRSIEAAVGLSKINFAPRKVRLAGRLEAIRYSDARFTLQLDSGTKVNGSALELGPEALREAFGQDVVVTGNAEFRPSGRLLRIDALSLQPASNVELKLFRDEPRALLAPTKRESPSPKRGLSALLGQWPGDESLEELLEDLRHLG